MTTPDDRLHAFDQIEPPDDWADITRRAEGPTDLPLAPATTRSTFRRPALIAAAVLVVAAIAGVAALAARPDDGGRPVASNGGHTTAPGEHGGPPVNGANDSFWGRRWTVLERFDPGDVRLSAAEGPASVLDTRTDGTVTFSGCNGAGARVRLDSDRLVQVEDLPHTLMGCAPDLLAQDDWFAALLAEGSTVTVNQNRLTLAGKSGKRVELTDIEGPGGDSATTSMPSLDTGTAVAPDSDGSSSSPVLPPGTPPGSVPPSGPAGPPPAPTTTFPAIAQPADGKFFNHFWQVTAISDGGSDPGFDGAVVVASAFNEVTVAGCNGAGGPMRLDGDRLRVDGEWSHTLMGCASADGTDRRMEQDAWFDAFLRAEPTVAVSGRAATLTTSTATVRLRLP